MACPCQKKRKPFLGTPVAALSEAAVAGRARSVTAAATGSWATTCGSETFRSLLRAQRAARLCGGAVVPA